MMKRYILHVVDIPAKVQTQDRGQRATVNLIAQRVESDKIYEPLEVDLVIPMPDGSEVIATMEYLSLSDQIETMNRKLFES